MSRILKGLAKIGYEPQEYSSVFYNNSLPKWTLFVGQELDVVCWDK